MSAYARVDVTPDTPEWEQERRKSIGASEVAAVMGLSRFSTALDVYKHKQGIDSDFDPVLAFIGHQSEPIMEAWVHKFSGVHATLWPGFMARSAEVPILHASFDRVSFDPFTTWQFKTAHAVAGHHWDEGIPTDIRVQVQAEMFVAGTQKAGVVVWIGGREFRLYWEPRDDRFIDEHMIPALGDFWNRVLTGTPPEPANLAEIAEVYPTDPGTVLELPETAFETLERITVLNSDITAQEKERDALKVALSEFVQGAETLTYAGRPVATWKTQKGRASFDKRTFELDHPDLAAAYTNQGAPFKVLRRLKEKS
ncbi:YqaJ viral recombinase family protein [Leifsonia sp. F6_8S_P_1B]|uniref:YqaJ viral recombinase family protein n=1 Tax=Leifsonia williamsii TaxID=3035919 RepID=A0ABT8KIY9_9MICO|nr:YqaJ viral recombinase family protein [Leifsonia williamsii]MDN4616442.1 YqaJ viral recombinase family protein [Leifsonia williamsii]